MNRRLFMGMLTGLAAIPAAVVAAVKAKPALPPIPDLPGFHTEWVKPREAMSQMAGEVFTVVDMAAYPDRDYTAIAVFKRHPSGVIEMLDQFDYPHIAVLEHGIEHLKWVSIDTVRRARPKLFIPSRTHNVDQPGTTLTSTGGDAWKYIVLSKQ